MPGKTRLCYRARVEQLSEVDVAGVEPMTSVIPEPEIGKMAA
ncbi:MAG: Asp-tRNA(Asn)/Glu-tRNA(Gln) amidotransferase subunit GatC [Xanthobacteraceae bacterium]